MVDCSGLRRGRGRSEWVAPCGGITRSLELTLEVQ